MPRTAQQIRDDIFWLEQKDRHDRDDQRALEDLRRELREAPEEPPAPKPTYAELLATPERFRAWLRRQPADRSLKPRKACACPLAEFLSEGSGGSPQVTNARVWALRGEQESILPPWATAFVAEVDALGVGPVYPGQCLTILRKQQVGE